jgi:hexokinase
MASSSSSSSDYIIEIRIDVLKTLRIAGLATGLLTALGVGAFYVHQRRQRTKRVILRDEVKNILHPFQLNDEQLRRVMANLNTEMTNGLKSNTETDQNDLAMFPTYVHHGPTGQETGEYLVVDLGGSNFRVSHVVIEGRNRLRLNNKIFLIPHSLLLGEGEKLFDYIAECLQRFIDDNRLACSKPTDYKFDLGKYFHEDLFVVFNTRDDESTIIRTFVFYTSVLAFTFSFPCNQTSLSQATLVSWTKGFGCTGVIGNDVVLMLQEAIDRRTVHVHHSPTVIHRCYDHFFNPIDTTRAFEYML